MWEADSMLLGDPCLFSQRPGKDTLIWTPAKHAKKWLSVEISRYRPLLRMERADNKRVQAF
jgi:hypothetical protein